jgi:hypothetical protein
VTERAPTRSGDTPKLRRGTHINRAHLCRRDGLQPPGRRTWSNRPTAPQRASGRRPETARSLPATGRGLARRRLLVGSASRGGVRGQAVRHPPSMVRAAGCTPRPADLATPDEEGSSPTTRQGRAGRSRPSSKGRRTIRSRGVRACEPAHRVRVEQLRQLIRVPESFQGQKCDPRAVRHADQIAQSGAGRRSRDVRPRSRRRRTG